MLFYLGSPQLVQFSNSSKILGMQHNLVETGFIPSTYTSSSTLDQSGAIFSICSDQAKVIPFKSWPGGRTIVWLQTFRMC